MSKGAVFGVTNGIITMLAIITGLYVGKVGKMGIIAAILAMIIADPASDAYSVYVAEKSIDNEECKSNAEKIGLLAFASQFALQILFLLIIIFSPNITYAVTLCYVASFIITSIYSFFFSDFKEYLFNIGAVSGIVLLTYICEHLVHKKFGDSV